MRKQIHLLFENYLQVEYKTVMWLNQLAWVEDSFCTIGDLAPNVRNSYTFVFLLSMNNILVKFI
jgi:hypothetical protein